MSDLISRADAIDAVSDSYDFIDAIKAIEELPSADAVPFDIQLQSTREVLDQFAEDRVKVVRCKDCRHGWYDDDIEYYTCRHPKGLNEELYGVDFCSYGERKE